MKIFEITLKALFGAFLAIILIVACNPEKKVELSGKKAIDPANMDTTVSPGKDFYLYANGQWIKNHPIPPEYSRYGAFNELEDENFKALRTMFEAAANDKSAKKVSTTQKIGDYYASGMDSMKIEKDKVTPLKKYLEQIDKIQTTQDLINTIGDFHSMGVNPLFYIYSNSDEKNSEMVIAQLYQGGLGLPERDYYLKEDNDSKKIREEYLKHISKMFELLGENPETAKKNSETIMKLEHQMAVISMSMVEQRDPQNVYHKMKIEELQSITPEYNWNTYFTKVGMTDKGPLNVAQPDFFKGIDKMLKEYPLDDWKIYLRWNLINTSADFLSSDFVNQNFSFYGKVLTGQKELRPRWKRVLATTSGGLGELVGELYVQKYFPPAAKTKMLELVKNLKDAFKDHIQALDWMTEPTKKEALNKLEKINVKIGYPDKWIDYSKLEVTRDSYVENVFNSNKFEIKRTLNKIGKPVDRAEWHMTPQTVNAYYNPNMNEIVFPAAILQPPFFYLNADDAVNYGAIGAIIGHEMTHGFDDQGRQYDVNGNLKDWWTKEDAEKFNQKVDVLVKQFNSYCAIDTIHLNGKITLGENIADLGGTTISHTAFLKSLKGKSAPEKIDGLTAEQRYLLSYAQAWRQNTRDEALKQQIMTDVHSPARFRVNGVMPNLPFWYEAFNVKPGDPSYRPPEERAKIW
jgi:putative endopeptidase